MTFSEPERLAIELRALIERRAALRAILRGALSHALSHEEQSDLRRVIDRLEAEMADLNRRLESLLNSRPDDGGTPT